MKVDLKRQMPGYSALANVFEIVTMQPLQYLMVDGHGDPNTDPAYTHALETLDEGMSVQTLHVGPYDNEGPVLEAMHA